MATTNDTQLAYALVTPYSLHKSRTGGILARLLWEDVHLVAARMYAPRPGSTFVQEYCDTLYDPQERLIPLSYQRLLIEYIHGNFHRPSVSGISNRMVLLVFSGPNAQKAIATAVGHMSQDVRGDNVRGTFGDFVGARWLSVDSDALRKRVGAELDRYPALQDVEGLANPSSFFEPGCLTGVSSDMTETHLKLFARHAFSDGGFVLDAIDDPQRESYETSMVILKPESFRHHNPLPGNLIDFFSRTGLYITGAKVLHLTAQMASVFYGLKLDQFRTKLKGMVANKAREIVERARELATVAGGALDGDCDALMEPRHAIALVRSAENLWQPAEREPGEVKEPVMRELFRILPERLRDLDPEDSIYEDIAEELRDLNARTEFNELIRYMTGEDPETGRSVQKGTDTLCMALLYSGTGALTTIRKRQMELREVYGKNILQNRAHASDPDEDPVMEVRVLGMPNAPGGEAACELRRIVEAHYRRL